MTGKSLFFLLLLSSASLNAASCDPPGSAKAAAGSVIATLGSKMVAMQVLLSNTLRLMTAQLTSNIQALPVAFSKIMSAQTESLSRIAQEGEKARIMRDFALSAGTCQSATLLSRMEEGRSLQVKTHGHLSRHAHLYAHEPDVSMARTVDARYDWRRQHYCGRGDAGRGICPHPGSRADGDVLPGETLLNRKTLVTQEDRQAAWDLSHTLLKPVPDEQLSGNQIRDHEGKQAWLLGKSREARQNLAMDVFTGLMAEREPLLDSRWMQEIMAARGKTEPLPSKISAREFRELEVSRRYENPRWYTQIQSMEPAEVQRQLLHMVALQIRQLEDLNRRLDQMTAIQSVQLSLFNEMKPVPFPVMNLAGGKK